MPFLSFAVTATMTHWMLSTRCLRLVLDHPNERSLHDYPIPRTGGVGIVLAVSCIGVLIAPKYFLLLGCVAVLALVSFLDDCRGLSVATRFGMQLAIATLFLWMSVSGISVIVLAIMVMASVWMTNLYNFMDGSNGLAGGMTAIGFAGYGAAALLSKDYSLAALCFCVTTSAIAFLLFNFHPARIFLGDVGSIPIGFLAAAIGFLGCQTSIWPYWFPIMVFSPFVVDASVTLLKRIARRERVWRAHRSHYYQRLVTMGWSHRKTALVEYALMLAVGTTALWGARQSEAKQAICVSVWIGIYFILAVAVDRKWQQRSNPS